MEARNAKVIDDVRIGIVQRLGVRGEDFELFADRVVRDAFKGVRAPLRSFWRRPRSLAADGAIAGRIGIVDGHSGGVDFTECVDRVDDHERIAALSAQETVRSLERLDRLADRVEISLFKRDCQRDIIVTTLIGKIFRRDLGEILKRNSARLEVVQDEHRVVANEGVSPEIQATVEDVKRVFGGVGGLVVIGESTLRRRRHNELKPAFRGKPRQDVGPLLLAETKDDCFLGDAALEAFVLFRGKDGFERLLRFLRNLIPLILRSVGELLGALGHEFVDALGLRFREPDARGDAGVEKPRITALGIEAGELNRFRFLLRRRIGIGQRIVEIDHHFCGGGRIFSGIGNLSGA